MAVNFLVLLDMGIALVYGQKVKLVNKSQQLNKMISDADSHLHFPRELTPIRARNKNNVFIIFSVHRGKFRIEMKMLKSSQKPSTLFHVIS